MLILVLLLFPFGGALAGRQIYDDRLLQRWMRNALGIGGTGFLVSFIPLWLARNFAFAFTATCIASLAGFVGPEILIAARALIKHPQVFKWIGAWLAIVIVASIFAILPGMIGLFFRILIIVLTYQLIFAPILRRR